MKYLFRLFLILMVVWAIRDQASFARFWAPIIGKLIYALWLLVLGIKTTIANS